ncbi:hypothetical protein QL285_001965 [Trifolium repens]|nr:hypothetical protein QL285_001965 [Trifolium repens]
MSRHYTEAPTPKSSTTKVAFPTARTPYLAKITFFHMSSPSKRSFQRHLERRLEFINRRSLMPKPPSFFGLQISDHFTQHILFLFERPPQRNFRWILTTSRQIFTGILRKERKKIGREFKTALMSTIRPPRLIYLLPQEPSLFLIESNIGAHVEEIRGFAPTGRPKYLKGKVPILQLRKSEAIEIKSFETFTPIRQLFQKLTLKPETNSKPLRTALSAHKFSTEGSPMHKVSSAY